MVLKAFSPLGYEITGIFTDIPLSIVSADVEKPEGGPVEASLIIELLTRFHCMSLGHMNRAVENLEQIDYKRLSGLGDYRFPNLIFDCWRWIVLPMHEMSVGQLR